MQENDTTYEESAGFTPARTPFSPRRLLTALRRHWWIVIITAAIPAAVAIYHVRNQPVVYVSRATTWVRGKLRLAEAGQFTEDVGNFFGTQIQLLQSDRIQQRSLTRLKANQPELSLPKGTDGRPTVPRIRVTQAPKSSMFILECSSSSGTFARAYLDAVMDEFLEYKKEVRSAAASDALASVSGLVFKQENELKLEQEKLSQFQRENNMALLDESLKGGGAQLAQMNAQIGLLRLELQLLNATAVENRAGVQGETNGLSIGPAVAIAAATVPSVSTSRSEMGTAQQQLELLKDQREQFGRNLRPKHPRMVRLNDEIIRAEKIIAFNRSRTEEQLAAVRDATTIRLKSLETASRELAEKVADANRRTADYERIRAGIARQQSFYERLLSLIQGVDLNTTLSQEDLAILERATPGRAAKSDRRTVVAGAGVGGMVFGLGIIFLLARLDDRCQSLVDLRSRFPEPVFGQVPDVAVSKKDLRLPVLQENDTRHILVESCRSLRSSLLFGTGNGERPKVILVTSAAPDEGKSTIAVNLASTLAQGGSRVLLMDADVRRGCLHKLLGLAGNSGLSECIELGGNLSDFVQPTSMPGLLVVPRGKPSIRGELFLTPAFNCLLQHARAQYDFIVIDSIPVFAADDTTTLAAQADGVLFVIRRGHTSARMAQEALELLYQRQAKILGIVFNRADSRSSSYSYYKYSKYHHAAETDTDDRRRS